MNRQTIFLWVRYWLNLLGMGVAITLAAFALLLLSRM